ncbi:unnamed protein product [Strongylus vulgaris]|uniref:Histone H2A/H2B/H3 domain-containing protein n=1 Tax=Strongylus vulgaris TaxID=40348 RepID=A0A3P7JD28_STRVU|nr:unnamed protein product [Strongylus vulgaris]
MPPKPSAKGVKKAAKTQKAGRAGDKKKRSRRKESYSVYIYRALKQMQFQTPVLVRSAKWPLAKITKKFLSIRA